MPCRREAADRDPAFRRHRRDRTDDQRVGINRFRTAARRIIRVIHKFDVRVVAERKGPKVEVVGIAVRYISEITAHAFQELWRLVIV